MNRLDFRLSNLMLDDSKLKKIEAEKAKDIRRQERNKLKLIKAEKAKAEKKQNDYFKDRTIRKDILS